MVSCVGFRIWAYIQMHRYLLAKHCLKMYGWWFMG